MIFQKLTTLRVFLCKKKMIPKNDLPVSFISFGSIFNVLAQFPRKMDRRVSRRSCKVSRASRERLRRLGSFEVFTPSRVATPLPLVSRDTRQVYRPRSFELIRRVPRRLDGCPSRDATDPFSQKVVFFEQNFQGLAEVLTDRKPLMPYGP